MSKMPFGNFPPRRVNLSGLRRYSTTSCNSPLHSSQPRTSLNVFLFFSGIVSLSYCFGAKEGVPESLSSSSFFTPPLPELVGGCNEDDEDDDLPNEDDDEDEGEDVTTVVIFMVAK